MKKSLFVLACVACGLFSTMYSAPTGEPQNKDPKPSAALPPDDQEWHDVQSALWDAGFPRPTPADPAARKAERAAQAARFTAVADRAKDFYTKHPNHPKAGDARALEVRALISSARAGDATSEGRLNDAVDSIRADSSLPASVRVQVVASNGFSRAMRGTKDKAARLQDIEQVARGLVTEFPDQPQGYESLMTVAMASDDTAKGRKIAEELAASPAPVAVKENARDWVGRLDLVGKPIASELDGAGAKAAKAGAKAGQPTVVYTWASWSPGSLKLAAVLKQHAANANVVALNLDQDRAKAEALAAKENLPGTLVYDDRGRDGALAQRLKLRSASQVILVDAGGKISDVRGEVDLEKKLALMGL